MTSRKMMRKDLSMQVQRDALLYRWRWGILLAGIMLVVVATLYGGGLFGAMKSGGFDVPGSESLRAQQLLDDQLGGSTTDIVILMRADGLRPTDTTFRQAATGLLTTLQARHEVASVTSYYSTQSSRFLSRDGQETFALVQLTAKDETVKEDAYNVLKPLITASPLHLTIGGNVVYNIQLNQQINADLEHAEILTFPIILILLIVVFGSVMAALLPLMVGTVAILGAFAILRVLTNVTDISIFAINIVTMLGLGLAIDYALLIVTRFREELAPNDRDVSGALRRTLRTAGRAVAFSGLTVSVSLVGLLLFPEVFLRSLGLGAIAAVLVALLSALTILPAALALLGRRINWLSIRRPARAKAGASDAQGFWYRLSEFVMRWSVLVVLLVVAGLVFLGLPFLGAKFATPDVRVLPSDASARIVAEHLSAAYAQEGASQTTIAITVSGNALSPTNLALLNTYVDQITALHGVTHVDSLVSVDPSLSLAAYQQLYAHPASNPQMAAVATQYAHGAYTKVVVAMQPVDLSADAEQLVRQIKAIQPPEGFTALVTGSTAQQIDLFANLTATIPSALVVIAVAIFVLLFLMTGSLLIPVKAIVVNLLSLTATFGALIWIFQQGHLQQLLGFQSLGSIDGTQPILIFATAFGLSMDYEVFLLSRIKERYDATGNNRVAVSSGLQRTGWLITSAALLLSVVLGAFATSKIIFIKEIGVGLAIAVLMDAIIVRTLLVPATMRLLGSWNWWAPKPLQALWRAVGFGEMPEETGEQQAHQSGAVIEEVMANES
jgi:uncharacterized membrane protein YdfJ with MMPL/SSD domain